jgi:hypothetical protein
MAARILNPFTYRGPIRDEEAFIGRALELSQILAFLTAGQCVSIVGPRRVGKTSLALHCARASVLQRQGVDPCSFFCVLQSCETWEHLSRDEIYQLLASLVAEQAPRIAAPSLSSLTPYRQLEQIVREISNRHIQLVIVLDEFDLLSRNHALDEGFFTSLRGLVTAYGLSFLTISTRPLLELTFVQGSTLSSPFFNVFAQVRLGLFTPAEADLLLARYSDRVGLRLPDVLRVSITQLSGPHPLLLQIAAFYAVESLAAQGGQASTLEDLFFGEARQHWSYWWQTLTPADRRLLALLPIDGPHNRRGVQRLIHAGLVYEASGALAPLSPSFGAFVQEQHIPGLLCAPPLTLDPQRNVVLAGNHAITLTASENALLARLLDPPGTVQSFDELDLALEGGRHPTGSLSNERVKAVIKTLRAKLGPYGATFENVRGGGFCFVAPR